MKVITDFVIGFLKVAINLDLKPYVVNLPGALGEDLGRFVKQAWKGDEAPLRKWIVENPKETIELFVQIQQQAESKNQYGAPSPLAYYMGALNLIVSVLKVRSVPIILKGFLNTPECLTCWDPEADKRSIDNFLISEDKKLISCMEDNPRIYILEGEHTETRMKKLNRKMRSENNPTFKYRLGTGAKKVMHIEEFAIAVDGGYNKKLKIPEGTPGLATMIEKLPMAMQMQDAFTEDVKYTFLKALENAREDPRLKELTKKQTV